MNEESIFNSRPIGIFRYQGLKSSRQPIFFIKNNDSNFRKMYICRRLIKE